MLKKIKTIIIFIFLNFANICSRKFFEKDNKNIMKKNLKNQNFYFKEVLFLIPKMQNHIYI